MSVIVREQAKVTLGTQTPHETGGLTHADAASLLGIGLRMGARLASWEGPNALRMHQFVGAVRVGALEVEILPKIENEPTEAQVRKSLLRMLVIAEDLDVKDSEVLAFWRSDEPILTAISRLYCARLADAVRRGLRQEYVVVEDALPRIRGKVHWAAQARLQASQRLEFECVFDERSEDTFINRTLKAALGRSAVILKRDADAAVINELRHVMAGVSDILPSAEQVAWLRTDKLNRHLEPLLTLAKLLLGNRNPDLGRSTQGDNRSYALVWDMNVLFERFVGRLIKRTLRGLTVDLQPASTYLARDPASKRDAFQLVPDILVTKGASRVVVADTKWKVLKPGDVTVGVSIEDAYQLVTYARRFQTDLAVLIYPHHPAFKLPGPQREFLVDGDGAPPLKLRIVTVDLAAIENVPGQLQAGFAIAPDAITLGA